jgi:hypothetical protein
MTYVFIDESGDLGKKQGTYFIMAGIATNNPQLVRKIITGKFNSNFRQYIVDSKIRGREIKAHFSGSATRRYVLSELSKIDCDIYAVAAEKAKILERWEPSPEQNRLYHAICSRLLRKVGRKNDIIYVIMDERHKERHLKEFFKNYIEKNFLREGQKIRFHQAPSHEDAGLLVVDFVAWAIGRKFNFGDETYSDLIKGRIRNFNAMDSWGLGKQRPKLGNDFEGVIIEESLEDRSVLKRVKILKTKVEKIPPKYNIPWLSEWTKDIIVVPESEAEQIAEEIRKSLDRKHDNWYAFFNNKKIHISVNKDGVIKKDSPPINYDLYSEGF